MDTRMIDVTIGLALVFALTSLLVTAMQEIYSSWRSLRGRMLHQAIVSILGDDADFAKTLLAHPLLVSLAPETKRQHNAKLHGLALREITSDTGSDRGILLCEVQSGN